MPKSDNPNTEMLESVVEQLGALIDALTGLLPPDAASQARVLTVPERMKAITIHARVKKYLK